MSSYPTFSRVLSFLCYSIGLAISLSACQTSEGGQESTSVLSGKLICVDAGHGGTADIDSYRQGIGGEREEWVNLRVAKHLQQLLVGEGAKVLMTREDDVQVGLEERAKLAMDQNADVFLSIHHNATADTSVNFPIIYFHANASENQASVQLARAVGGTLQSALFPHDSLLSIASDHTIFPRSGTSVLRHSYGIPGVIGEASFFTNPSEEQRLKQEAYNLKEAEAYVQALKQFFSSEILPIQKKYSQYQLPPFQVLQEAERMEPAALRWREDYEQGKILYREGQLDSAYQLLTRSARSFPDSYIASDVHSLRSEILMQLGKTHEADTAAWRAKEYYVKSN